MKNLSSYMWKIRYISGSFNQAATEWRQIFSCAALAHGIKKKINPILILTAGIFFLCHTPYIVAKEYNILHYGATGDGKTINTHAINTAIEECFSNGGGTVIIPEGIYLSGTIRLKDNVQLYIREGGCLRGIEEPDAYRPFIPAEDLKRYNTSPEGNISTSLDARWNRALVLAAGITNASITGQGIIDGSHVFDPLGEENMRGPHAVMIAGTRNFVMEGITVTRAANYAVMGYEVENILFRNLSFHEGWDGIHIRGGKNVTVRDCTFHTGDDAIAGGYWENMQITGCYINSSCNGIRMIMPAENLTISHCVVEGPGKYPHRTSGGARRNNTLSAIILQPGAWGVAPGEMKNVHIHDVKIENVGNPLSLVLNEGNNGSGILVERLRATRIHRSAFSVESWKGGVFDHVLFRDVSIEYTRNNELSLKELIPSAPGADVRPLPCWGAFVRNVRVLTFENLNLKYTGTDARPAMWLEHVGETAFRNVSWTGQEKEESIVKINSGSITIQ